MGVTLPQAIGSNSSEIKIGTVYEGLRDCPHFLARSAQS